MYFLIIWSHGAVGGGRRAKKGFEFMFKLYRIWYIQCMMKFTKICLYMLWIEKYVRLVWLFSDMIHTYLRFRAGGGALCCVLDPLALCFKPWNFNNWWHDSKFHVPNMKALIQFNYCTDINKDGRTKGPYRRKRNIIKNWIEMLPLSIYWVEIIRLNHIFFEKTTY